MAKHFDNFFDVYQDQLNAGLQSDQAQAQVAKLLATLAKALVQHQHQTGWKRVLHRVIPAIAPASPKGIYLWGGVGRGKTFLMDLFFEWLPITAKRRMHFHHFMQHVHQKLHEFEGRADPLRVIANEFREHTLLLCFDEFYVADIGDAMILAELLEALFNQGLVFLATSNTAPTNLYENGLQRSKFVPAIHLIESNTHVHEIGGAHDYRLEALHKDQIYRLIYPTSLVERRADQQNLLRREVPVGQSIAINKRKLSVLYEYEGTVGFTFHELCETPRNASDYIELARLFHTVVLYDIPILGIDSDSSARRFIALIDEFYDRNVNVIFYAQAPIHELYQGHQLVEPFKRTISRVIEMQSDSYLSAAHKH
ncbi:MAG: AFG1 family ATPase [Gammaproteobacteria bacterium]|nr:AFG1 family ATPase [Gammaproteobacteria bacterium]